jgi:thiamine biosynthesis lipoprotein
MRKYIAISIAVLATIALAGCGKKPDLLKKPYTSKEFNVGTYIELSVYDKGKKSALSLAEKRVNGLEKALEVNEEGVSQIDKVNSNAGKKPVKVSGAVYELVNDAIEQAKDSKGYYDPAIGAMTNLWHIGFPDAHKPTDDEIKNTLDKVDYKDIILNKKDSTVFLKKKGMLLDFGGIAKGFVSTQMLNDFKKAGVTTAVINLGAHVYVLGDNPATNDGNWKIAINNPSKNATNTESEANILGYLTGKNRSYITTGKYQRYLESHGKIYSHLMNPKTGYPYENKIDSVTVVGVDPIVNDALSNIAYNKGLKEGMKYVNDNKGYEAIFVTEDKKIHLTKGLKKTFVLEKGSNYKIAND